ncbi:uncharacterized protein SCODWIG_02701 [Saccharomycodes ludwigii]|uniref:Uncharacterized protein n=1 Tax=Saccharomycodes ludwigii TaxID=36035 RepID=A0A376B9Y7_9ASCO|nr:hypothetical protein SCDLUD_003760 [Saccharomycodes ludwigii]KAH3900755.1 hypothetical protein SCDLUD_003760 [Saccharomycodes ludwigii]SSD60940.1 uncharacterized protein SCODWIG_02701 [Saccharomycodes ludwigii]
MFLKYFGSRFSHFLLFKRTSHSGISLATRISELVNRTTPQTIYSYTPKPIVKIGSWSISAVFLLYSLTFADWSFESTKTILEENAETGEKEKPVKSGQLEKDHPFKIILSKWFYDPVTQYYLYSIGVGVLSVIPIIISLGALYLPSRMVTGIKFNPTNNMINITTLYKRQHNLNIRDCILKGKLYTGKGSQGCDDNGSFAVFLIDDNKYQISNNIKKKKRWWSKMFILSRSGTFIYDDCRILDVITSRQDILKEAERLSSTTINDNEGIDLAKQQKQNEQPNLRKLKMEHQNIDKIKSALFKK